MSPTEETLLDLSLSRGSLDRSQAARREPDVLQRALKSSRTRVLDLADGRVRTCRVDGQLRLVLRQPGIEDSRPLGFWLGRDQDGVDYVALVHDDPTAPDRPDTSAKGWRTLREAGAELNDTEAGVFTTALALAQWHARHPHCPRCGSPTEVVEAGWMRRCPEDGSEHHPRTDAAIIVAVTDRDNRLLLARGPHWPETRMSVLAGFVEAGESLESAVAREVHEEVGIRVQDITYRGNQPWPFPASLMVGFTARAVDVELHIDGEEIVQAEWFSRGELGWAVRTEQIALPPRVSIARRLIEDWFGDELEPEPGYEGPRTVAPR
ncbi:NAD(+) diphosphatase [Ornithinicoccus halotolerans]|uniref:NAD(+) diphosphatase n=1 Tax=Ornithinicoccus halotolerans TaxID=1748220 RepID=UPI001294D296|nr:NAD(+) diphosphatase [Ornithinicoccus halotolerans]